VASIRNKRKSSIAGRISVSSMAGMVTVSEEPHRISATFELLPSDGALALEKALKTLGYKFPGDVRDPAGLLRAL
jgi:hypothetical protein